MTPSLQAISGTQRMAGLLLVALLFVTPFSKGAVESLFPVLLLAWLSGWKRFQIAQVRQLPGSLKTVFLLLLLYLGVCAASVLTSEFPALSLRGFTRKTLEYALLFVIAADVVDQPQVPVRCIRALLAAAGLVVLYGLLQEWAIAHAPYIGKAFDPIRGHLLDYLRMVGPYENPNDLATFLMVSALIAVAWGLACVKTRWLPLHLAFTSLLAGCLAWTQSRGAILGFFAAFGLLGVLHWNKEKALRGMAAVILVGTAFFLLISRRSLFEMLTFSDAGSQDRAEMWNTGWKMFMDRPIWGHGLNTFMANYSLYAANPTRNPAYAHNCFLQIAAETGLVGLGAFLLFLGGAGSVIWKALRIPSKELSAGDSPLRTILAGLAAATVAFLIQSMLDTNLYALRQAVLFWTLAGVAVGLSVRLLRPKTSA